MEWHQLCNLFILLFISTTGYADYCCDFETTNCNWVNTDQQLIWGYSEYVKPARTEADFGAPETNYLWLQEDIVGDHTGVVVSPHINISDGDVVNVTVYKHLYGGITSKRPILAFVSEENHLAVEIINDFGDGWTNSIATCGEAGIQCCVVFPCTGRFSLYGVVSDPKDLYAIESIVVNKCGEDSTSTTRSDSTTSTIPTVPPTTSPDGICGLFDDGPDGWATINWVSSIDEQPNTTDIANFTWASGYMWTQNTASGFLISPPVTARDNTPFSMSVFAYIETHDLTNKLTVYFQKLDNSTMLPLLLISNSNGGWLNYTGQCTPSTPCCPEYPCDGNFYVASAISEGSALFAVDNVEMDGKCTSV